MVAARQAVKCVHSRVQDARALDIFVANHDALIKETPKHTLSQATEASITAEAHTGTGKFERSGYVS
jgi:hypothetical protein